VGPGLELYVVRCVLSMALVCVDRLKYDSYT